MSPNAPKQPADPAILEYPAPVAAFVERLAGDLTDAGMQRMAARVFACLLASEQGALGSAELGERLRISPAAISGAVRYLAPLHLVTRERVPGSRRERYRVHAGVWYESMTNREALLNRWLTTFDHGRAVLGPDSAAGRRIGESAAFLRFFQSELVGIMERWREYEERGEGGPGPRPSGQGQGQPQG